jgi:hypothetical protein
MAQNVLLTNVTLKDQNQNKLDAGDYEAKAIYIKFLPTENDVKINIDGKNGSSIIYTAKQVFHVYFLVQDEIYIPGGKHGEKDDQFTRVYKGNANIITVEGASGSNSIKEIQITSDGIIWTNLKLINNPSQLIIIINRGSSGSGGGSTVEEPGTGGTGGTGGVEEPGTGGTGGTGGVEEPSS